jgi:hypothetical protein
MKTAFLIPVYQEKTEVVRAVLEEILSGCDATIFLGDDGNSQAAKSELSMMVKDLQAKFPDRLRPNYENQNHGQGFTLKTLTRLAFRDHDIFVTFDSDGQHCFKDALAMVSKLQAEPGKINVLLGSRFLGHKNTTMPKQRKLLLLAARVFMRLFLGYHITDPQCGLRVYDKVFAQKVMLNLESPGMAHANEILDRIFSDRSIKMAEFPVDIVYNKYTLADGQSNSGIFKVALDFFNYKFKRIFHNGKKNSS